MVQSIAYLVSSKPAAHESMPAVNDHDDNRVTTVGDWMITLLVQALPLANIIMYLVWAFSSTENLNHRNVCRASLLWFVIGVMMAVLGLVSGTAHHR